MNTNGMAVAALKAKRNALAMEAEVLTKAIQLLEAVPVQKRNTKVAKAIVAAVAPKKRHRRSNAEVAAEKAAKAKVGKGSLAAVAGA